MVPYYYPRVTERVSTALLDMFNDIQINRFNEDGTLDKIIDVPIVYHGNKNFTEFLMNTSRVKESRHPTPIMGLRLSSYNRDEARITQQKYIRTVFDNDTKKYYRDRRPSAWIIGFTLSIYTENLIDFTQLIESIVTYFDPTLTLAIKEFEGVNIERDIIVSLDSTSIDMNDEVDREDKQTFTVDLTLSASCVLYPPVSVSSIITKIKQNMSMKGRNFAQIQNEGVEPMTISDYNRVINETVELGKYPDSIVVGRIISKTDNEMSMLVNVQDDPIIPLTIIPGGSVLLYVSIQVTERFNSFKTTMSIGTDENNSSVMSTSDNSPSFIAKYAQSMELPINSDTSLNVYYNRSNATEGIAVVTIAWA